MIAPEKRCREKTVRRIPCLRLRAKTSSDNGRQGAAASPATASLVGDAQAPHSRHSAYIGVISRAAARRRRSARSPLFSPATATRICLMPVIAITTLWWRQHEPPSHLSKSRRGNAAALRARRVVGDGSPDALGGNIERRAAAASSMPP